jgi:cytochrome c peroxidase
VEVQLLTLAFEWAALPLHSLKEKTTVLSNSGKLIAGAVALTFVAGLTLMSQDSASPSVPVKSSYQFPVAEENFMSLFRRTSAEKPEARRLQMNLLSGRYDLSDRPDANAKMSRGKPLQTGVRVKLSAGVTWEQLSAMSPEEIRAKGLFPAGFLPLPHPKNSEGGMVFPHFQIDEIKAQTGRDLQRFDVDFDIADHFLPEFPGPMYLTTRPDLGDVSQGKLVTTSNYYELFNGILNPKQLEGLRLLLTPFAQQQFNETADRRTEHPSFGVACFDCHQNGSTNAATHQAGDVRPQEVRHRIDIPSLRGVNVQRLFGSQRALKTVEDFTEFEQRAAYFDGDPVIATKKGVNILERGSQIHDMGEFQEILDFPPAPKLNVFGKLDVKKATPEELRGQDIFFGNGQCGACHQAPYYTDNLMHNLHVERFCNGQVINGLIAPAGGDGPIKTPVLRGLKDTPPYFHDDRLMTLDDTVEVFNLILGTKLTPQEKKDLVAFLKTL